MLVSGVQADHLPGCLVLRVVVQHARFVGVDVPGAGVGDLPRHRAVGQGVVEVPGLAKVDVSVGARADVLSEQVGVARKMTGAAIC